MRQIIPDSAEREGRDYHYLVKVFLLSIKIKNNLSLFQLTIKRFYNSKICKFEAPIIMTNENYRFLLVNNLKN